MKYFGLIWTSLFRKPVRSALTFGSIFIAFLLFGVLQSVSVALTEGPDLAGVDRLVVAPKYSIIDDIPLAYQERIRAIQGVGTIAHQSWFGGTYKDSTNFFPRWPVPPREFMEVYSEYAMPEEQKRAFANTRTGAIVGKTIAEKYDMNVGDKIVLIPDIWQNKDNGPWEFDLVGIYDSEDEALQNQMFMNYDYFDEYRSFGSGGVGTFVLKLTEPARSAEIAVEIDAMFANSNDETKTSTEKAYNQMFAKQMGDIGFIMTSILSAVFFTILLLTGNTMSQAIRERIPELAILKTLGFTNVGVLIIVLTEAIFIALIAAIPAIALAGIVVQAPAIGSAMPFLADSELTNTVIMQGIGLAVLLGLVAGGPPAIRAMRLSITDALGEHA